MALTLFRQEFFERKLGPRRSFSFDVFHEEGAFTMQNRSASGREWWDRFKDLLDAQVEWPSDYLFKFIVPRASLDALKAIFGRHPVKVRTSSKGNYVSVTARLHMASSDEVLAIYHAAGEVEGVISL